MLSDTILSNARRGPHGTPIDTPSAVVTISGRRGMTHALGSMQNAQTLLQAGNRAGNRKHRNSLYNALITRFLDG
jgi:hypothetical protein